MLVLVVLLPLLRDPSVVAVQCLLPVNFILVLGILDVLLARSTPVTLREASVRPRDLVVLVEIGLPNATEKLIRRRLVVVHRVQLLSIRWLCIPFLIDLGRWLSLWDSLWLLLDLTAPASKDAMVGSSMNHHSLGALPLGIAEVLMLLCRHNVLAIADQVHILQDS